MRARAEQSGGNYDSPFISNIKPWRPKSGENLIRICPPTFEGAQHYGMEVFMHRFVGSDSSNYICNEKMNTGKPCAVCDEMRLAKKEGDDEEAIKKLAPQKRIICYVIDRDGEPDEPLVYDLSWTQDRDIASQCDIRRTGQILYIDHPDDGYDLTVKKTGSGKNGTKYQFIVDREPSPLANKDRVRDAIMDKIAEHPLDTILRYDTYEHVQKKLSGGTSDRDDDRGGRGRGRDDDRDRDRGRGRDDDRDERARGRGRDAERDLDRDHAPRGRGRDDDDRPRGRRDPDEGDERDPGPSRGRGRDDDPPFDADERPRGRGRGDDDGDERDPGPRRGRGRDDDGDDDRPRGRGRDDDRPARSRMDRD